MSDAVGLLKVTMVADNATFKAGLDKSEKDAEGFASRITGKLAGALAAAFAGVASVDFLVSQTRQGIDFLDTLDDIAEKTGIAAGKLSELKYASEVAGTPFDALQDGLKKLAKNMADSPELFDKLGVKLKDANGQFRGTDDVLVDLAERFSKFEDGPIKAADAMAIFGKQGDALLPFLNKGRQGVQDLREEAKRFGVTVTDEAAKAAGDFNDTLKRLELASDGLKVSLGTKLLPTLTDIAERLNSAGQAGLDFGERITAGFHNLQFWNSSSDQIVKITKGIAEMQARLNAPEAQGDSRRATWLRDKLQSEIASQQRMLDFYSREVNRKMKDSEPASVKGYGLEGDPSQPKEKPPVLTPDPKSTKDQLTDYERLIGKINERIAVVNAESSATDQLTESDKLALQIMQQLADGQVKLSDAEKQRLTTRLDGLIVADRQLAKDKEMQKSAEEMEKAIISFQQKDAAAQQERLQAFVDATPTAQLEKTRKDMQFLADAFQRGQLSVEMYTEAVQARLGTLPDTITKTTDSFRQFAEQGVELVTRSLSDLIVSGGDIKDLGNTFVEQLQRMALEAAVITPTIEYLKDLIAGKSGSANNYGGIISAIGSIFSAVASANGNAFGASGVHAFANGGAFTNSIVSSPTLFAFAKGGKLGLMGEAGDEAVMPLTRGANGRLGVDASGMGGSNVEVNLIESPGRGGEVDERQEGNRKIIDVFVERVRADVIRDVSRGGDISQALQDTYGLSRQGRGV